MRIGKFSLLALLLAAAPLGAATISVTPSTLSVAAGSNFTLSVQVTGATDLYGYQFDLAGCGKRGDFEQIP